MGKGEWCHQSSFPVSMRPEGLEPPRVAPPAPKAGASANSATVAYPREIYNASGGRVDGLRGSIYFDAVPLVLALFLLLLTACSGPFPQSVFAPRSDFSSDLDGLYKNIFWWAVGVFVIVETLLLIAIAGSRAQARARPHLARDRLDACTVADSRIHRRPHDARDFRDRRTRLLGGAARRGYRAPVVVGIPLSHAEHQCLQ